MSEIDYYQLELDDMVIALNIKDAEIKELKEENKKLKEYFCSLMKKVYPKECEEIDRIAKE